MDWRKHVGHTKTTRLLALAILIVICVQIMPQQHRVASSTKSDLHTKKMEEKLILKAEDEFVMRREEESKMSKDNFDSAEGAFVAPSKSEGFDPFVPPPLSDETLASANTLLTSMVGSTGFKPLLKNALGMVESMVEANGGEDSMVKYNAFKNMFMLWNPEASKWARNASINYRSLLKDPSASEFFPAETPSGDLVHSVESVVEQCGCTRTIIANKDKDPESARNASTCSQHSFDRGRHQRTIGFSFYGDPTSKLGKERKYFQGIKDNLELLPKYYPGWVLRLYYDLPAGDPLLTDLCDLACNDPNIDLCYVKTNPAQNDISQIFAMNWRFLPVLDPQVDHYASRDLDSRLNAREEAAVSEWLRSSSAFHLMRDHPAHSIEILGSGWGVRIGHTERRLFNDAFAAAEKDPLYWAPRKAYGPDQGLLKRYIWPWAKWNALSHDSYTCVQFPRTRPFPVQRRIEENNFVASVVEAKDILRQECPEKCRPQNHKDWKYC